MKRFTPNYKQQLVISIALALSFLFIISSAFGSGIPDQRNVNIIGINPPTAIDGIPDKGLKQQNEPACGMKPSNPLHIICAFNDYRGVDNPAIGDAWEGYSYSINGGQTWFSDLLPGHPADTNSVGLDFAADPLVAVAPGVALIAYIAADRTEKAEGGLFMHRMFEVNREAGAPWVPAMSPIEISRGSAGQFIDKPFMLLHPAATGSDNVLLSSTLKDGTAVELEAPAARLFLAHTVFVGNDENVKSKMLLSKSDDYGATWSRTKLSESQAINQSSSIAGHGDNLCTVWRRFENKSQSDAILLSCSSDRGDSWSKASEISVEPEFFPFDQGTTTASFRVNSYPVIASDGNQFYVFWANRNAQDGSANADFSRIVYSTSTDGNIWTAPTKIEATLLGHQFQPSVTAAAGTIQLAWYDTRTNFIQRTFVLDLLDPAADNPAIDNDKIIRNQGDIRTIKITNGVVSTPSVQVSRYLEGALSATEPSQQLEFNFLNDRIFKQGTTPFIGDYANVAAPIFRVENGEWVSNVGAVDPASNKKPVDFLVAWSDNRDVRGNVWEDLVTPTVYTPALMEPNMAKLDDESNQAGELVAENANSKEISGLTHSKDEKRADAEPDLPGIYGECVPGTNADRSRNQNVYASIVRPGVSFESPSATKQTGTIQRAHVVWVSNNQSTKETYKVTILSQPSDAGQLGRASFLQVPVAPFVVDDGGLLTEIDVIIDPNSTVARTVYITSATSNPQIDVSVGDGAGVTFGTLTLNPDIANPDVQNPDVQNPDVQNPDVQNAEVHNPDVQNPDVQNPDVQNPDVQNPDVQNPDVQNPDVQNPDVQNPDVQNPDVQNPDVQNTTLDPSHTENPDVANDTLSQDERDAGYTDFTFPATNNGNTTTAFNLDAFVNGNTNDLSTQLIGFRSQVTESARDCVQVKQIQNQVIFNLIDPDLSLLEGNSTDGVFSDGSAYIAPGETIYVTLRVWGDPDFDVERVGIKVQSQSCNTEDKPEGTLDCEPPAEQVNVYTGTFTETVIVSDLDILNDGVLIVANDLGASPSAVTVNGVAFGTSQSGQADTEWLNGGGDFSTDAFSPELDSLLSDLIFVNFGRTNGTFTINNLETGIDYRLQLLFSNDVNVTGNNTIVTVEGSSIPLLNWQDDAVNLSSVFTASSPSVTVDIDAGPDADIGSGRGVLNAYALHAFYPISPTPLFSVPDSPVLLEAFNTEVDVKGNGDIIVEAIDGDIYLPIECSTDFRTESGEGSVTLDFDFPGTEVGATDTIVTCSALNVNNLYYSESFVVRVEDTISPEIQFKTPDESTTNFYYSATSATYSVYYLGDDPDGGEFQTPHVEVFDDVDFNVSDSLNCVPASEGNELDFPVGDTTVSCTATDANGNEASDSFIVRVTEAIDVTITSVSPTPGGAGEGFVVVRGTNLPLPSGTSAVVSNGEFTTDGFVFLSPSTTTSYWVRLPSGFPAGSATIQIQNGALLSNAFPITVSATPGIPIITEVFSSPEQLPTTTATPGGKIGIAADGIDTIGWQVLFTQGASTWEVFPDSMNFAQSNATIGLALNVVVPAGLAPGSVDVSVRQGASAFSTPVSLTIDIVDEPPQITVPASPYVISAITLEGGEVVGTDPDLLVTVTDDIDTTVSLTCGVVGSANSVTGTDFVNFDFDFPGTNGQTQDSTVTCTATDSSGNEAEESFTVRVDDTIGFTWRGDFDFTVQPLDGPYVCLFMDAVFNPGLEAGETMNIAVFDEDGGPQIGSYSFTATSLTSAAGSEIFLNPTQMTDGIGFNIITLSQANAPLSRAEGRTGPCIGPPETRTGFINGTMTKIN